MISRALPTLMFPVLLTLVSLPLDLTAAGAESVDENPWATPRSLENFSQLLKRSPFSLPTAEESSPLTERFSLTGAVSLFGKTEVFVFDKNTQNRERLTAQPNEAGLQLVEYLPNPDPRKMQAVIRFQGETGSISFQETMPSVVQSEPQLQPQPAQVVAPPVVNAPPATNVTPPRPIKSRRVIRRPRITGGSAPQP